MSCSRYDGYRRQISDILQVLQWSTRFSTYRQEWILTKVNDGDHRCSQIIQPIYRQYVDNCNHTWPTDNATESMHQLTIRIRRPYCKRNLTIPILDHLLISDEHFGTHQLSATTYLYRVPAVINKEQPLKTHRNL